MTNHSYKGLIKLIRLILVLLDTVLGATTVTTVTAAAAVCYPAAARTKTSSISVRLFT